MKIVNLKGKNDYIDIVLKNLKRHNDKLDTVKDSVKEIIDDVRKNKDRALLKYIEKFDGVKISSLKVEKSELKKAYDNLDEGFKAVLNEAKENITKYHSAQKYEHIDIDENDKRLTQKVTAIERVGLYVPGGKSPYPSTVLMDAIPAKVAGVREIVLITPPQRNGKPNSDILAASYIAGVDEVYLSGGAGAIAALAYGSETIKPVYKICGPGNLFVAEAKKQVYGDVDIDMIAGPSEILIIAGSDMNPKFIASDLLSQAEHDENACVVLVSESEQLVKKVLDEVEVQIKVLEKEDIARKALENFGICFITNDMDMSFDVSNAVAPEHLEVMLENPFDYVDKIQNAGSVFMGEYTPEPVGDYFAGSNHTIPTSGKAKFYSPLSTFDFLKRTSIIYYSKEQLKKDKDKIALFADRENFTAHKNAVLRRFEDD